MKSKAKTIFDQLVSRINIDEPSSEKEAVIRLLFENEFGLSHSEILINKEVEYEPAKLDEWISRLNANEPVQYILGSAYFFGRKFKVNASVLIPRPETELLINEVLKSKVASPRILDVGTGSGCIPITLKLEVPNAQVLTVDISNDALLVAKENAQLMGADVEFIQNDFLADFNIPPVDIIVSNPPYIKESEKKLMKTNVLQYEPHRALFVPENDPLLFYKGIASKSKTLLKLNGKVFVEINEHHGNEVKELFQRHGFKSVQIVKDLDGKDRIVSAQSDFL